MKRKWIIVMLTVFTFLFTRPVIADEKSSEDEFRVGMETAYAPFNWTQTTDANGAVPKDGNDSSFAGGYDVEMAKKIADGLGKELVIMPIQWDGLVPALNSGKIDAIIAGMSPTAERREEIDFTDSYYESDLVIVTHKDNEFADATSLEDFTGARITAQLNTFHYTVIDQIPEVDKQQAVKDFSAMRVALASHTIDGYVSERPEGVTAGNVNKEFEMIEFSDEDGFQTEPEDVQVAVGMRKNDPDVEKVNEILETIPQDERDEIMDTAVANQPSAANEEDTGLLDNFKQIIDQYGVLFLKGAGTTLLIAIFSTVVGVLIGLFVGVIRMLPTSDNTLFAFLQKVVNTLLTVYIEVFRGTPMMVQAMVIFYGFAMLFNINMNRLVAALLIVSINTGAYMAEIVRGGIMGVDDGQFEAAQAIGMTHKQTMQKIIIPQVLRNILPAIGNEIVINIKDTAVLSVISVGDLFFQGTAASGTNLQFFQTFTIIGVMYLVMTLIATRLLRLWEKRLDGPEGYIKLERDEIGFEQEENHVSNH